MAARVLVVVILALLAPHDVLTAKQRQEIRFYKANKDGITSRMRFTTRKSRKHGCHNLIKSSRLFRVSQFGYQSCFIYSEKDCREDSKMTFSRDKGKVESTELLQGYGWSPLGDNPRGEKMKSWQCSSLKQGPSSPE